MNVPKTVSAIAMAAGAVMYASASKIATMDMSGLPFRVDPVMIVVVKGIALLVFAIGAGGLLFALLFGRRSA